MVQVRCRDKVLKQRSKEDAVINLAARLLVSIVGLACWWLAQLRRRSQHLAVQVRLCSWLPARCFL